MELIAARKRKEEEKKRKEDLVSSHAVYRSSRGEYGMVGVKRRIQHSRG